MATITDGPQVLYKNGKPRAVVLDIRDYTKLLELVADKEDLAELQQIKKTKLSFRDFQEYLKDA